jgi:hypothetical protein
MNRRLLVASLFATLLAGCQLSDKTEGPVAACMDVGSACTENRACCSYGCVQGFCMANPEDGGQCRTSDDCASGACRNGRCDQSAVCRDESDRCDWDGQCCTETCNTAGTCVQNGAPTVVATSNANAEGKLATGTAIVFDARGSSDPDGDYLSYGWQVIRVPSLTPVACANGSASATCTISAPQLGAYRAVVTVTDRKVDSAPQGTVEVEVVNLPPVVQTLVAPATQSRNVAFTVSASVVDPDGDPLSCTWTSTAPGGAPQSIAGATCAEATFTATAEGTWAFTIHPDDGVDANAPASRTVTVTVINDAPVVSAAANVYGNMGETETTTPPVTLVATATDLNDDAPLAFLWTQTEGAAVVLTNATAATTTFVPPSEGTYVFSVTATDPEAFGRIGATSAPVIVTVHVAQPVMALPGTARDVEFARTGDLLVVGGVDPANATKGKLWVISAATGAVVREASLPTPPTSVSTNADATLVAVGAPAAFWWVTFGTSITVTEGADPFAIHDVVLAARRIYLFGEPTATGYIHAFDTNWTSDTATLSTYDYGSRGRLSPSGTRLFVIDDVFDDIVYYSVNATGGRPEASLTWESQSGFSTYPSSCTHDLWVSPDGKDVFTSCGDIYTVDASDVLTKRTQTLGGYAVHVDARGGEILVSRGGELDVFDAYYQLVGSHPLPIWGFDGGHHPASAEYAFLGSDGARYAVVTAGGRSGLVSFAP